MDYVPVKSRGWNGHRLNGAAIQRCMSVGRRRVRLQHIRSLAMNSAPCANSSATRPGLSCSRLSATAGAINRLIKRIGERAGFDFIVHAHMLRHACGYALANRGHDTRALQAYLGHKNIQHTVRYTELSPTRFKDFWHNQKRGKHPGRGKVIRNRFGSLLTKLGLTEELGQDVGR